MEELDDYSFRKPGAVPFKWESKPGVPKPYHTPAREHGRPSPKLTPPPSGLYFTPPPDFRSTRSFRSVPRLKSDRHRLEPKGSARPIAVSTGCFFSPFVRRRWGKKSNKVAHKASPEYKPLDLGTLTRWTDSGRKSSSLWESSTYSSSFSSYRSSPQPVRDPEWAGYGLF